jgi:hypothetical protein
MCHLLDWATCPLLVFLHVATDREVQRLGTLEEKYVTICIGSRNPKGSEYISIVSPRRHVAVDIVVRRPGTLGIFKSLQVKSVEARSCEGTQTIDLGSLWDLSQPLDQEVEGQGKHFDELGHSRGVEQHGN